MSLPPMGFMPPRPPFPMPGGPGGMMMGPPNPHLAMGNFRPPPFGPGGPMMQMPPQMMMPPPSFMDSKRHMDELMNDAGFHYSNQILILFRYGPSSAHWLMV